MVWVIPVILEVRVGLGGELSLNLKFDNPESGKLVEFDKLSLELQAEVEASLGIGCAVASVGVYGNVGMLFVFDILPQTEVRSLKVSGDMGISVKALWFKKKFSLWSGAHYIIGGESAAAYSMERELASVFLVDSYEYSPDIEGSIRLVTIDGELYKFYMSAVEGGEYDEYNRNKLVYSKYGESGWSEPVILDDNGYNDAAYTILQNGKHTYIAYTQQTKKFTSADVNDTYAAAEGLSIKLAHVSDGDWVIENDPVVNGNVSGEYKYLPQIGGDGFERMVVWAENSDNNIFGVSPDNYYDESNELSYVYATTANSIHVARFKSGAWVEETLASGLSTVVDMALNGEVLYYVLDADGDLSDRSDCTLYITDLSAKEANVRTVAGVSEVECKNGKVTYYSSEEEGGVLDAEDNLLVSVPEGGYITLADDGGNINAVLYKTNRKYGEESSCSVIMGVFLEKGVWGSPVPLYDLNAADMFVSDFDAVRSGEEILIEALICDATDQLLRSER